MITVLTTGPLATFQDLGRPGYAHLGVSSSGALDRGALRKANRLVGNPESAAVVEVTVGGLRLRWNGPAWLAVTGAWGDVTIRRSRSASRDAGVVPGAAPMGTISTTTVPPDTAVAVVAGDELLFGHAGHGMRYYLAVRGGFAVAPVLGSAACDTLSGIGPAPLAVGDELAVGAAEALSPIPASDSLTVWAPSDETVLLRLLPGPRVEWFTPAAHAALYEQEWTLSAASNRVGARLEGQPLTPAVAGELPSEGMVAGSIQVPPSGSPVVLLADHPVTGGYPVIAVVADASLDVFAQLRPGQRVRFRHAGL